MTADVELLPLYAELQGHPKLEIVKHYARAVAEYNVKARDAEIEAVTAEAFEWRGLFGMAKARADKAEARAERLAEALREVESELGPEVPLNHDSGNAVHRALSAAMAALNQEGGNE